MDSRCPWVEHIEDQKQNKGIDCFLQCANKTCALIALISRSCMHGLQPVTAARGKQKKSMQTNEESMHENESFNSTHDFLRARLRWYLIVARSRRDLS